MNREVLIKTISTVLLVMLLICNLSLVSCVVNAKDLEYSINKDGKSCTITGIGTYSSKKLYIPATIDGYEVTAIGDYAFEGTDIESLSASDKLTKIGNGAFKDCNQLRSVTLPNKITEISYLAFANCSNLSRVVLPQSLKIIGQSAFKKCSSISSISIPYGTTKIDQFAFYLCDGMTSIDIPDTLEVFGDYSFMGCQRLNEIKIPDGTIYVGSNAFALCVSLKSIYFPASVINIGIAPVCYTSLTNIEVDEDNPRISSIDGNLYYIDNMILANYAPGKENVMFDIPSGVIEIGHQAFAGCLNLKYISVPSTVKYIGNIIFYESPNIETLYYDGTIDEWNSIIKADDWNKNTESIFTIICTDGTIAMDGTVTYN